MGRIVDVAMSGDTRIELVPLRMRPDGNDFIIGRPAAGSYLALSHDALVATELLRDGRSIADTRSALSGRHGGEVIRLRPLLQSLLTAGLVTAVDGVRLPDAVPAGRHHLTRLRRNHVAWLFSLPALGAYLALVGAALAITLGDPRYLPRPADVFVSTDPWINLAALWAVSIAAITTHELAHFAAAAFLGIRARFSLGNRLFFGVAQTDLTELWLVDRNRRYLAYVAGMASDLVLGSAAVVVLWLAGHGIGPLPPALSAGLRLAVLVFACGILWQFNFYLRTDVYYLVANATGCRNLARDARAYLKARLVRVFSRAQPDPLAGVPANERRFVRVFAVVMVAGTAFAMTAVALYLAVLLLLLVPGPPGRTPSSPVPLVAPAIITAIWLALSLAAQRRRRPAVRYQLVCPEDL